MPKTDLTAKQQAIFDYIIEYWAEHGWGPNTKDVQREFGFASYTTARDHLYAIANKGYLEFSPGAIYPAGLQVAIKQTVQQFKEHRTF